MYKIVLYIALICIIFTTLSNAQRSPRASTTSTSSETPSNSVSRSTGASNSISASLTGSVSQSVTRTVTPSTTSTNTASATNTPSNAPSGAASNTPTNTVTPTASVTPSGTSSISVTPSGTSSSSVTPSNSGSSSITPSISGSSSNTPSSSVTPSTTPSTTRSITATPSSSFIPIANNTVSCLYCNRESIYRSRNASSNAFIAASNLGLVSSSPSGTPSISTTPSNTPSISVTPSTTPSNTPSISVTPSITPSISTSSSPSSSASPSSSSSASNSISGTSSNTPSISASSSISPSFSPSASALGNSSIINSQTICGTGSFRTDGGILTLVYNTSQQGAAYFNQTYNLTEGFLVQFDVHLYQPTPDIVTGPNGERYNKPADGFAFCAQQDSFGCNAVGYNGEGIGYDGIENALCVEFDVYFNNPYGDPDSDHIAVMASDALGALVSANHDSSSAVTPPLSLLNTSSSLYPRDGYPFDVNHTVRVTYDGTDEVLEVTLNGRSLIMINSTKVRDLQLNGALLGFTSSTGGYGETVDISSFFARVPWSRPPSASPTPSASASASSGLVLIPTGLARKEHFDD